MLKASDSEPFRDGTERGTSQPARGCLSTHEAGSKARGLWYLRSRRGLCGDDDIKTRAGNDVGWLDGSM